MLMCGQEFENKSDMQRHAKEAHRMEEKGHKCSKCFKSFPSSQQLAQHSLVHTNVRKYPCRFCEKAFKQLSHVQQHQRIHTGDHQCCCNCRTCKFIHCVSAGEASQRHSDSRGFS